MKKLLIFSLFALSSGYALAQSYDPVISGNDQPQVENQNADLYTITWGLEPPPQDGTTDGIYSWTFYPSNAGATMTSDRDSAYVVWFVTGQATLIYEYTSWNNVYATDELDVDVQP